MEDRKEYFKKYREENRKLIRERNKKYYDDNKLDINKKKKIYHEKIKDHLIEYRESIKDSTKEYMKEYRIVNKEKIIESNKKYKNKNKDKIKEYKTIYNKNNKENYNEYIKNRLKTDDLFRLSFNVRTMIRRSFKIKGLKKNSKTVLILGCSILEFKKHIESLFEPWMNWNNYGLYNGTLNYGWDIDHIIGLRQVKTEEEIIKLNHYTNLQPLCGYCNRHIKR